jgi:hypothetical protein
MSIIRRQPELFLILLLAPITIAAIAPITNANSQAQTCGVAINSQIRIKTASQNIAGAIAIAMTSPELAEKSQGYGMVFSSVFNTWSFDTVHCSVTAWKDVNVVFALNSTGGAFAGYIVVTVNPPLTNILSVTFQEPQPPFTNSPTWSGYEFHRGTILSPALVSLATWTVYPASIPSGVTCANGQCEIAPWTGLVNAPGGTTGIAQGGTLSSIKNGGSRSYTTWYEFYPHNPVFCTIPVKAYDSISAEVYDHAADGGPWYLYDIYVDDYNSNQVCQVVSYNFSGMGQPWFSEFIAERRAAYTLAQFPNFGIWGETDFQGTYYTNYQSYTTGWWTEYIMYNGCGNNIAVSSVDSTSTFSESWQTSCGTY